MHRRHTPYARHTHVGRPTRLARHHSQQHVRRFGKRSTAGNVLQSRNVPTVPRDVTRYLGACRTRDGTLHPQQNARSALATDTVSK
jgi:hypothetical protein